MRVWSCIAAVAAVCAVASASGALAQASANVSTDLAALKFDRFFIMMFENHGYSQCMSNSYWQQFAKAGLSLSKFTALTHPSQPNYIAQLGGDTLGCADDNNININATSLVDLLDAKSISWKSYQEDYHPLNAGDCNPVRSDGKYYRKHNPFMSFDNVRGNKARCNKIVNAAQLDMDIQADALPQFSYYTPNIDNDAHNTNLDFAGKYLKAWLDKYMNMPNFSRRTLVLITFDEDEYLEGNHIYAVLLGPYVTAGTTEASAYTHYSITKTVELNWALGDLGRHDAGAKDFLAAIKNAHAVTEADVATMKQVIAEEMSHPRTQN